MKISDLKTGTRLKLGFAIVLLLLVCATTLALRQMSQFQQRLDQITSVNNVKVKLATTMRTSVFERLIALRNLALGGTVQQLQEEANRIEHETRRYADAEKRLQSIGADPVPTGVAAEKALLLDLKRIETAALPLMARATRLAQASQVDQAYSVLTQELLPEQRKWMAQLDALVGLEDRQSEQSAIDARTAFGSARTAIWSIAALALLLGAAIALAITRRLERQLGGEPAYAARIVRQIAGGDLTAQITLRPRDRDSLLYAMRTMRDSLADMVGNVRNGSGTIVAVAGELSAGNGDVASRTGRQAGELKKTAARMERLTATVKHNADTVRHANTLSVDASGVAVSGSAEVASVVETMEGIKRSATRIADIISVIDGIAFQTNILALNAAVEAARAGEQGRGFAVVASEVRNLAQRATAAAKEIKVLITDAVDKVDAGSAQADKAGATITLLAQSTAQVTRLMQEITVASNEQHREIEQVNQAIMQMDGMTRQNAALVEQAATATEGMQQCAHGLAQALTVFRIAADGHAARTQRPPASLPDLSHRRAQAVDGA